MMTPTHLRLVSFVIAVTCWNLAEVGATCSPRSFRGVVVAANADSRFAQSTMGVVAQVINEVRQEELDFDLSIFGRDTNAYQAKFKVNRNLMSADLQPTGDASLPRPLKGIMAEIVDELGETPTASGATPFVIVAVDEKDTVASLNATYESGKILRDNGVVVFVVAQIFRGSDFRRAASAAAAFRVEQTSMAAQHMRVSGALISRSLRMVAECDDSPESGFGITFPDDGCFESNPKIDISTVSCPQGPERIDENGLIETRLQGPGTSCLPLTSLDPQPPTAQFFSTDMKVRQTSATTKRQGEKQMTFQAECVPTKTTGSIITDLLT